MLQSIQLTATNRSRAYPMRLIEYDGLLLELFPICGSERYADIAQLVEQLICNQ